MLAKALAAVPNAEGDGASDDEEEEEVEDDEEEEQVGTSTFLTQASAGSVEGVNTNPPLWPLMAERESLWMCAAALAQPSVTTESSHRSLSE